MIYAMPLRQIGATHNHYIGGKAFALSVMAREGMAVPDCLCVTSNAYKEYIVVTGIGARIGLELNRKDFRDMRWEELWDASLRIRNMFLTTPLPETLGRYLRGWIDEMFSVKTVVVRSSAPGEDSSIMSFAGLHESYVNITGTESILEHIRLVWASLWSDRALLYRKELGLDLRKSTMAVVVQEFINGERSGVLFTQNPVNYRQSVIEAVHGLNQGLVDGTVEPDRWFLDRKTGNILAHTEAKRDRLVVPHPSGVSVEKLSPGMAKKSPLRKSDIRKVFTLGKKSERVFGSPQDIEWCFRQDSLYALQSRPITASSGNNTEDQRSWYLSLHRSHENLKMLRKKIEQEIIPGMEAEGAMLAKTDLRDASDDDLAVEIEKRQARLLEWRDAYMKYCIPFAHGIRLFGQMYNDVVKPAEPFEFMDLLSSGDLKSLDRNRVMQRLSLLIREDPALKEALEKGMRKEEYATFWQGVDDLVVHLGILAGIEEKHEQKKWRLVTILLQMAEKAVPEVQHRESSAGARVEKFLGFFNTGNRSFAMELLDLGKASYRLRDDDNIALGKVEDELTRAIEEGRKRLVHRIGEGAKRLDRTEIVTALRDQRYVPRIADSVPIKNPRDDFHIRVRQIVGQPAGSGIAAGKARVILHADMLLDFKKDEILVCDAVDPNMTFIVPLAAAIVERRGGMLIHGAIIAREYGIPCVTGIPDATEIIGTGDQITVDGYLGIIIIQGKEQQ